jgi:hypothetical protein
MRGLDRELSSMSSLYTDLVEASSMRIIGTATEPAMYGLCPSR